MTNLNDVKNEIKSSALELIGNTPLLALDRLHPGPGRILVKCEFMNPGGSIKCRSSLHMIQKARERGELKPGGEVVEVTSGNQGCGLAIVCLVLGHPLTVTMSKGNSIQRLIHMEALGAKCIRYPLVKGSYGKVTFADVEPALEGAMKMSEESGSFFCKQMCNPDNVEAHYKTTGAEIWRQSGHRVDAFVSTVGTSGTFTGVSTYLKEQNPDVQCFVVEPEGSQPLKGCEITKPFHILQGASYGVVPDLFKPELMEDSITVTDDEAVHYKDLLGTKEGLFVGYTSGANVAAAVKLLNSGKIPKDAWIVTILCDTGLKYTPVPENLIN